MSAFIDHVKAEIVERHSGIERTEKAYPYRVAKNETELLQVTSDVVLNTYQFGFKWGYQAKCREMDWKQIKKHIESAVRELRHAVYGDLFSQLHDLERAVLSGEREEALAALKAIQDEVYG